MRSHYLVTTPKQGEKIPIFWGSQTLRLNSVNFYKYLYVYIYIYISSKKDLLLKTIAKEKKHVMFGIKLQH